MAKSKGSSGSSSTASAYPPVSFRFKVTVASTSGSSSEAYFKEVKGIGATMAVEEIREGGMIDTVYNMPGLVSYDNLVLTRGLAPKSSDIISWCIDTMSGKDNRIVKKQVVVALLNADQTSFMEWTFADAFPVKWSISDFNAMESDIAIETIEFKFSKMSITK